MAFLNLARWQGEKKEKQSGEDRRTPKPSRPVIHTLLRALVVLALWLAVAGALAWWRKARLRELGRTRLEGPEEPAPEGRPEPRRPRPFVRRHPLLPWLAAALVVAALSFT